MIELSICGETTFVRVTTEKIDLSNVDRFLTAIRSAISPERTSEFIIDLSAVQTLAAPGINVLVALHKQLQKAGGGLHLRGVREGINARLQTLNLTSLLNVDDVVRPATNRMKHGASGEVKCVPGDVVLSQAGGSS